MKVDIVNQNSQTMGYVPNLRSGSVKKTPHFTGMSKTEKEMMNLLHHKKVIEVMKSFEWLKGEIGGILLTALGTGLVAPIFIGFNPFVHAPKNATPEEKEDVKNTKQYTAMRQPVSAALAILFQAGVQKYIDKGLDAVFNNPELSKYARLNLDQQVINTDSYIKANVRKEMDAQGMKKPSLVASWFSKDAKARRDAYTEAFDNRVDAIKDSQIQKVADGLEETGKIIIGERNLDHKTTAELVNKEIQKYINDAKKLKKTHDQIVFYKDRAQTLMENEDYLKELFKDIPLEKVRKTMDEKELKGLYEQVGKSVQELLDKETNPKVRVILQEIMDNPEDLRANRIERTLQRIESIKKMCRSYADGFTVENYEDALHERNKNLEKRIVQLKEARIKSPGVADENVIKAAINKVAEACKFKRGDKIMEPILENTNTFSSSSVEKLSKKVFKDVAKAYKKLVDNNYKSWNQITKIGVGVLITLPITCTALNWVYPRFMELFFPKLAGVKKDKAPQNVQQGGDK